jgi:hypothetical protein
VLLQSCQPYSHHRNLFWNKSPNEHYFSFAKSVELLQNTTNKLHFLGKNRIDLVCGFVSSEGLDEGYEVVETREMLLDRCFDVGMRILSMLQRRHLGAPHQRGADLYLYMYMYS